MNLLQEKQDGILIITINRPKSLNALNQALISELEDTIDELYKDEEIRGAIITGAGEKSFVAGADISEFIGLSKQDAEAFSKNGHRVFDKIEKCPKPIIAAVNGFALGGGCELAMACHMRIAADSARFGQPEIKLGIIAGYGGTQRLVQNIGRAKATELLLTGEMIKSEEALRLGLVNYVVPQADLIENCLDFLRKVSTFSSLAIAQTLDAIDAGVDKEQNGYDREASNFGTCVASEDGQEGASAFLEKRAPEFKGK